MRRSRALTSFLVAFCVLPSAFAQEIHFSPSRAKELTRPPYYDFSADQSAFGMQLGTGRLPQLPADSAIRGTMGALRKRRNGRPLCVGSGHSLIRSRNLWNRPGHRRDGTVLVWKSAAQ